MGNDGEPLWYGVANEEELKQLRAYDDIVRLTRAAASVAASNREFLANRLRERFKLKTRTPEEREVVNARKRRYWNNRVAEQCRPSTSGSDQPPNPNGKYD